jgi:hypothetical protein
MRFYVYTLTDPTDGSVFYVGKGKGLRMYQHVVEARRDTARGNKRKLERIRKILEEGKEPLAQKVAEYEDEQDAFDHEADLIAATPGLTNILARGGGWAITKEEFERRRAERQARWFEREKTKLRERLKVWDEWERHGMVVTFPGMKAGDERAAEYVAAVRQLLAA